MDAKTDVEKIPLSCPHIDRAQALLEQLAEQVGAPGCELIKNISDELEDVRTINRELRGKAWEYAQHIELQEIDKTDLERQVGELQNLVRDARTSLSNTILFLGEYANAG